MAAGDVTAVNWDVVVVGAGVIGCSAAYHLSQNGCKTLLLDQFLLPHSRGSSSSQTRIIRNAYDAQCYAAMMPDAFRQWRNLERESGETLIINTEYLAVGRENNVTLQNRKTTMNSQGLRSQVLSWEEIRKRCPDIQYPSDYQGLLDPGGGIMIVNKCLKVLQDMILKYGGRICDGTQVRDLEILGSQVTLITNKGQITAKQVVLCPGPWAKQMLQKIGLNVPLTTMPGRHAYWRVKSGHYEATSHPIIIHKETTPGGYRLIYMLPSYEYPNMVKVSMRQEPPHNYCGPESRDSNSDDAMLKDVAKYIRQHFPYVETTPSIIEPCVYTMTPDHHIILDKHPVHNNILIAAGFSGHGFKLGPVIGQIISDVIHNKLPSYDLSRFKINRFNSTAKSRL